MGNSLAHFFVFPLGARAMVVALVSLSTAAHLALCIEDIQLELDRRRPGQSDITTPRRESDSASIVSGVYEGKRSEPNCNLCA